MVCMAETATVKEALNQLEAQGLEVERDFTGGVAKAKLRGVVLYWAMQKGKGGPWIVRISEELIVPANGGT